MLSNGRYRLENAFCLYHCMFWGIHFHLIVHSVEDILFKGWKFKLKIKKQKDMENGKWSLHLCVLYSRIIVQKHVRIGCK